MKIRRSASPADLKNDEAIKLSMYPAGKPPGPNEIEKIERDDWPGPASPAALLPEICEYSSFRGGSVHVEEPLLLIRKSSPESGSIELFLIPASAPRLV